MLKKGKGLFWIFLRSKLYLHGSLMILFVSLGCTKIGLKNDLFSGEDDSLFKKEISIATDMMLDSTAITPGVRGLTVLTIHKYDTISNSFSFSISYVCSKWDYYQLNLERHSFIQRGVWIYLNLKKGFDEKLKTTIFRKLYAISISRNRLNLIESTFETLENDFSNYQPPTLYVVVKDGKRIFAKYVVEPPTIKEEVK